jgi:hypothetical protein
MTVKTEDDATILAQNLELRNKEVEKAYNLLTQASRELLKSFEHQKYRTVIEVNHMQSGKESNLQKEFMTFFFNITLTRNRANYSMVYFTFSEDAIAKFGARLYTRALRVLFKYTMFDKGKISIEDSVRVNNPAQVENYFVNRLANGENNFISIEVEPLQTN